VTPSSSAGLEPVFQEILAAATRFCEADSGCVLLCNAAGFETAAVSGATPAFADSLRRGPLPAGPSSALRWVATEKSALHFPDLAAEAAYQRHEPDWAAAVALEGARTGLHVPMLRGDDLIGIVTMYRRVKRPFTEEQIALARTFAGQAVVASENVRLLQDLQSRDRELAEGLDQQRATSEILRVIAGSRDLQPVLDTLVKSAARLSGSDDAVIRTVGGDGLRRAAHFGSLPDPAATEIHPIVSNSVGSRAILERRAIHVEDIVDEFRKGRYLDGRALQEPVGYRTVLATPLLREDIAIGVILIRRMSVQPFTDKQVALLKTFADQAVIAIENARLFNELHARNRDLTEALEQQTATAEILRVISSSPTDATPVFETIVASARRLCEANFAAALLYDGDRLRSAAHTTVSAEFAEYFREGYPVNRETATGRAALSRRPVQVNDILEDREFLITPAHHSEGVRAVLAVPMLHDDVLLGVISTWRLEVRPFSDEQIKLLETFAAQAVIAIENVRLFRELQARNRDLTEALDQQTATAEILRVISSSPTDVQPVFETIVRNAVSLCGSLFANVFRFDGELLHFVASHDVAPGYEELLRLKYPMRPDLSQVSGRVLLTKSIVRLENALADQEYDHRFPEAMSWRRMLGVPMLREGVPLGAIVVGWSEAGPVPKAQEELLKTFADQAAIAIENVRLVQALQAKNRDLTEALQQQTATAEILRVISRSPTDVQPVFDTIVRNAVLLCGSTNGAVFRYDGELLHYTAGHDFTPEWLEAVRSKYPLRPDMSTVSGRAILTMSLAKIDDVLTDPQYDHAHAVKGGWRRMLAVPMLREGVPLGAIVTAWADPGSTPKSQEDLLRMFADQAVIAIENVRLFRELQARNRDLTEALEQQTATSEVLKVISRSTFDLEPVLQTLIENATRLCSARHGHILRFDGRFFQHAVSYGASTGFADYFARHPSALDSGSAAGRAGLERRTVHIHDVLADPEYQLKDLARTEGFRTLLAVPMLREGVLLGTINLWKTEVEPFTDRQIELVTTFADQAVIAIENVRLFQELQARTGELARSVEELEALGEVGRAVSSTLDLEQVLTTIVARALELSGADGGTISEYDESTQQFHLRTTHGVEDELAQVIRAAPIRLGEGTSGRAAATRAPVQVVDILDEREYDVARVREVWARYGYRSALSVPLLREDRILGALTVWRRQVGEFPSEVVNLLQTFATQSTLAIQHARLFRELEYKGRELELASRHKSEFLANMSHELRTPLNAVLGYTELILDGIYGEAPEKISDVVKRIDRSGRHLLGLINDVLDLSKIEAGQLTLLLADYSMREVVQTVFAAMESLAAERKLALKADVAPDLPRGRGDERRLSQVLLNLVGNAIKFTEAGEVRVEAGLEDGRFLVSVTDTGPGISPEDQQRIFEAFQQVDSSLTRKKGGTGLGLSIAKRIVEMHGGRLWVASIPGQGSTFSFSVPVRVEKQVTV
jgi:GAF domain-containing protein